MTRGLLIRGLRSLAALVTAHLLGVLGRPAGPVRRYGWIAVAVLIGVLCGASATAARLHVRDAAPLRVLVDERVRVTAELVLRDDPRPIRGAPGRPATLLVATELARLAAGDRPAGQRPGTGTGAGHRPGLAGGGCRGSGSRRRRPPSLAGYRGRMLWSCWLARGPNDHRQAAEEAEEKRARLQEWYAAAARGQLSPARLAAIEAPLLAEIEDAERRSQRVDIPPLVRELVGPDVRAKWEALPIRQQREVVSLVIPKLRVGKTYQGARRLDPARLGKSRWAGDHLTWAERGWVLVQHNWL
ncbi:hypothetical protein ACFT9M_21485 [Micromonospora purpureochromogenes]|uniref:hypothetical protein n=1 Tax=Micromonospora purpureochromogenes TaxID=47872 RepID=UPI0036419E22